MLRAGLLATLGAVVAVAIAFLIGDAVSGPLIATSPGADAPEEIALGAALSATVVGGIAGLAMAVLAERLLPKPVPVFVGVCIVGLIAYGIFTFSASEGLAAGVWLNVTHIVAAIPIVGLLARAMQTSKAGLTLNPTPNGSR